MNRIASVVGSRVRWISCRRCPGGCKLAAEAVSSVLLSSTLRSFECCSGKKCSWRQFEMLKEALGAPVYVRNGRRTRRARRLVFTLAVKRTKTAYSVLFFVLRRYGFFTSTYIIVSPIGAGSASEFYISPWWPF